MDKIPSYTFICISSVFLYALNIPMSVSVCFSHLIFIHMYVVSFCQRVESGYGLWVKVLLTESMIQLCKLLHVRMTASELFLYLLLTIS